MRHSNATVKVIVAAFVVAAGGISGAASAASKKLPITPKVGKPSTAFVTRFVARYPTSEGEGNAGQFYYYEGHGPGACREFGMGTSEDYQPGDKVKLRMTPFSIGEGDERTTWCPGRYSGKVTWLETTRRGLVVKEHSVGRFSFTVKR
jgi:hypothetical protein